MRIHDFTSTDDHFSSILIRIKLHLIFCEMNILYKSFFLDYGHIRVCICSTVISSNCFAGIVASSFLRLFLHIALFFFFSIFLFTHFCIKLSVRRMYTHSVCMMLFSSFSYCFRFVYACVYVCTFVCRNGKYNMESCGDLNFLLARC